MILAGDSAKEKVAYLRGLLNGADFAVDERTRQFWGRVLDVLGDLAHSVDEMRDDQQEVIEYLEALGDDVTELQTDFYDEDQDREDGGGDADQETVRMDCPHCGEPVSFDSGLLYEDHVDVTCPNCGKVVFSTRSVPGTELEPAPAARVPAEKTARQEPPSPS